MISNQWLVNQKGGWCWRTTEINDFHSARRLWTQVLLDTLLIKLQLYVIEKEILKRIQKGSKIYGQKEFSTIVGTERVNPQTKCMILHVESSANAYIHPLNSARHVEWSPEKGEQTHKRVA